MPLFPHPRGAFLSPARFCRTIYRAQCSTFISLAFTHFAPEQSPRRQQKIQQQRIPTGTMTPTNKHSNGTSRPEPIATRKTVRQPCRCKCIKVSQVSTATFSIHPVIGCLYHDKTGVLAHQAECRLEELRKRRNRDAAWATVNGFGAAADFAFAFGAGEMLAGGGSHCGSGLQMWSCRSAYDEYE